MNKCVRVSCTISQPKSNLALEIQKNAKKLEVEGHIQVFDGKLQITACGNKDKVDDFVDIVHKMCVQNPDTDILEVEPFMKDKDYRGVFRIIE